MLVRAFRKLFSALSMVIGALLVGALVDMTPMIGSPQIDYPQFDFDLPFWPQLALEWIVVGGGGVLLAALGMLAWSDQPVPVLSLGRTATAAASWFAVISGLQLAKFLAWGTMGPLNVQQPIIRFAITNGLICAVLITLAWLAASRALQGLGEIGPWHRGAWMLVGASAALSLAIPAIGITTGLPLKPLTAHWWPFIVIIGPAAGLLASLTWRGRTQTL